MLEPPSASRYSATAVNLLLAMVCLTMVYLWPGQIFAHPYHVSMGSAEYDREKETLEVSIHVAPEDLQAALELHARKKVDIESDDADQVIAAYLKRTLIFKSVKGERCAIEFVGKQVSAKAAWLHFQVKLPGGLAGVEINHRLFLRVFSGQVNTLNLRDGDRRTSLEFTARNYKQKVEFG